MKNHKALENQRCETCKKWRTPKCDSRKYDGTDAQPQDWCAGYRKLKEAEFNMVDYANRLLAGARG